MKKLERWPLLFFLLLVIPLRFHAQQKDTIVNIKRQYVKFDVSDHVFMCPVLGPRFINNLKKRNAVKDIVISEDKNSLFFTIPQNSLAADSIISIAIRSAFPANMIKEVKFGDKPFEQQKQN